MPFPFWNHSAPHVDLIRTLRVWGRLWIAQRRAASIRREIDYCNHEIDQCTRTINRCTLKLIYALRRIDELKEGKE